MWGEVFLYKSIPTTKWKQEIENSTILQPPADNHWDLIKRGAGRHTQPSVIADAVLNSANGHKWEAQDRVVCGTVPDVQAEIPEFSGKNSAGTWPRFFCR